MIGKLTINGHDAWTKWGVFLENGSYSRFLSGHTMKPYTTNESRSVDGNIVSIKNPRVKDRELTIVFCFVKRSTPFISRYSDFIETIRAGKEVDGVIKPNEINVSELGETYKLIYDADMSLENVGLEIAKVAIKFNEPNPADR